LRLVAGGWFVLREKYCWLVADKPSEQAVGLAGSPIYPPLTLAENVCVPNCKIVSVTCLVTRDVIKAVGAYLITSEQVCYANRHRRQLEH
jgi:hypothetical protein